MALSSGVSGAGLLVPLAVVMDPLSVPFLAFRACERLLLEACRTREVRLRRDEKAELLRTSSGGLGFVEGGLVGFCSDVGSVMELGGWRRTVLLGVATGVDMSELMAPL